VIDIHCHILPEVDDGPKTWDVAEAMCHMAARDGIRHMVATPHANERFFYDREYLNKLLQQLQGRIGPVPELSLGCDFHLSYENMQSALEDPARFRIGKSRYLLVEFNNFSIPQQLDRWLDLMVQREVVPIVTHPERNPILQKDGERVLGWVKLGCAVQITASVLTGSWGERSFRAAEWLLNKGAVHFLATDAHDTSRRPPVLSRARQWVAQHFDARLAKVLVEDNPAAVIHDAPLIAHWR
jgi:protein-tyrosine phosphatase